MARKTRREGGNGNQVGRRGDREDDKEEDREGGGMERDGKGGEVERMTWRKTGREEVW